MRYIFNSLKDLMAILDEESIDAVEFALRREAFNTGTGMQHVMDELDKRIAVTRSALVKGVSVPQKSRSGLVEGGGALFFGRPPQIVKDPFFHRALAYSLAINEVNACGGKIVAFPTAGSSGIVPGIIWAWWDSRRPMDPPYRPAPPPPVDPPFDPLLRGAFLMASLTGILIAQGSTLAGAEGGCQAECGAAGAMAACALAHANGCPLPVCFNAAALSLKNSLGLACDPVAGLVEVPCVKRNAFVAANAVVAVELAAAGIESAIPFDEVVLAMKNIGDSLPASLRESAMGGLAVTPTGLRHKQRLSSDG